MKRFISIILVLVFILSLSACSCNIDWSSFDLTKRNFGLTKDEDAPVSSADTTVPAGTPSDDIVYSDDIINYTVPENSSVVYASWQVVPPEEFRGMAMDKLLEIAEFTAALSGMKDDLSSYPTVVRISSDEKFSRILNNIRAWSYGAVNYPTDGLSEDDIRILEELIIIGTDSSEFGSRFPALIITNDTDSIGEYEDLIFSCIVSLNQELDSAE